MITRLRLASTLLVAAIFGPALLPASADDFTLTGTYEGFFVCDDVVDGAGGGFGRV